MCLPPELHRMLFDYLDDYDRLCLLLTCKYFARVGSTINAERHYIPIGTKLLRINQGFSNRMPKRLSLCTKCGVMRPKDITYWEPHRCGWDWRKLIPTKDHRSFADRVHAWGGGWSTKCPRCFATFLAQGNLHIGELPCYGNTLRMPTTGVLDF